jgi:hypothetical protein
MELKIFDTELVPLGTVDETESVIWQPTYWSEGDYGDVKILAPITDNNSALLVKGNLVIKHGDSAEYIDPQGHNWRRCMQITYRHITKDENDAEQIEVQGCFIKKWLSKRIILKQIIASDTNQGIINRIVDENVGEAAGELRRLPSLVTLPQDNLGGEVLEYSNDEYVNCNLEIHNRAVAGKLGYDILADERGRKFGFWLYKGNDLTYGNKNGNKPCIFSRDFDNVNEQEYTESIENMGNVAYVTGAADEDNVKYTIESGDIGSSGLDRDEIYIEASDISWKAQDADGNEVTISLDKYLELLATRGNTELEEYGEDVNFTSIINASANIKYMKDFFVGDRVTCVERRWGIRIDARVTQVSQTFQDGKEETEVTFGESLPTLIDKIRKVR